MSEMYFEAGGCTDSDMVEAFSGDERFVQSLSTIINQITQQIVKENVEM